MVYPRIGLLPPTLCHRIRPDSLVIRLNDGLKMNVT
jgi:hypothetical protein